jgi:hypothetical protein
MAQRYRQTVLFHYPYPAGVLAQYGPQAVKAPYAYAEAYTAAPSRNIPYLDTAFGYAVYKPLKICSFDINNNISRNRIPDIRRH